MSTFSHWEESGHVPDDVRVVSVGSRFSPHQLEYLLPMEKQEASGALAAESLRGLAMSEGGGILLIPVIVPLAAALGAIRGVPAARQQPAERVLTNTFARFDLAGEIRRAVVERGRRRTRWQWEDSGGHDAAAAAFALGPTPTDGRYQIWLSITSAELAPGGDSDRFVNPRLRLRLRASCEVIRCLDGKSLFYNSEEAASGSHRFARWAAADGRDLRAALDRGVQRLADRIVASLLTDSP